MNGQNPTPPGPPSPPQIPPVTPAASQAAPPLLPSWAQQPLGTYSAERVPISGVFGAVEAILRHPRRMMFHITQPNSGGLIGMLLGIAAICALVYGLVVGTFSGSEQLWAAQSKS